MAVTAVFALLLVLSLALAAALIFVSARWKPRIKALLVAALVLAWVSLGFSIAQIAARTSSTLVTPGGERRPEMVESAAREALLLLASLGGPAALATLLGVLAMRAARRPRRPKPGHMERAK